MSHYGSSWPTCRELGSIHDFQTNPNIIVSRQYIPLYPIVDIHWKKPLADHFPAKVRADDPWPVEPMAAAFSAPGEPVKSCGMKWRMVIPSQYTGNPYKVGKNNVIHHPFQNANHTTYWKWWWLGDAAFMAWFYQHFWGLETGRWIPWSSELSLRGFDLHETTMTSMGDLQDPKMEVR